MKTRVALKELTQSMLTEVFNSNHLLQVTLLADYYKKQTDHINEIRAYFDKGISELIVSLYGHNRIVVNPDETFYFVMGVSNAQARYAFLPSDDEDLIADAEEKMYKIAAASTAEYTQQNDSFMDSVKKLADLIAERFCELLKESQNKDELLAYFITHYTQEELPYAYILFDENGHSDYVLHKRTVIEKKYN